MKHAPTLANILLVERLGELPCREVAPGEHAGGEVPADPARDRDRVDVGEALRVDGFALGHQ